MAYGDHGAVFAQHGEQVALLFYRQPIGFGQVLAESVQIAFTKQHQLAASAATGVGLAPVQQGLQRAAVHTALLGPCLGVVGEAPVLRRQVGCWPGLGSLGFWAGQVVKVRGTALALLRCAEHGCNLLAQWCSASTNLGCIRPAGKEMYAGGVGFGED